MYYNVYRQETSTGVFSNKDFKLIGSVAGDVFVDIGLDDNTTSTKVPPDHTITQFASPSNLAVYNNNHVADLYTGHKNTNWIRIILYQAGDSAIPVFQLERLKILLTAMIPPEIGYTIIVCNDTSSEVLI